MQNFLKLAFVLCAVAMVIAHPRAPAPSAKAVNDNDAEPSARLERQAGGHHHEHVDFGAHTGHKGAFGWYADFPVIHGH